MRKGENISAKEIEDLLYTHPKVVEVAVIGLPDAERGERVCAVVQLADGADALELAEVVAFCRDAGLMTQKIPEQLEVRTDWPRAGTGKIVKKTLRDEYADGVNAPIAEPRRATRSDRGTSLPHRLRLHGQHLPLPDGRGHHPRAGRSRPRSRTARRWATTSRSAAPAPVPGTRASRCTRYAAESLGRGGYPRPAPRRPPVRRPPSSGGSTSWWPSIAGTSRRCAASGPTPTASCCSAPSTPPPARRPTCRTPTTATRASSTTAAT